MNSEKHIPVPTSKAPVKAAGELSSKGRPKALEDVQTLLEKIAKERQIHVQLEAACQTAFHRMQVEMAAHAEKCKTHRLAYFRAMGPHLKSKALKPKHKKLLLEGLTYLANVIEFEHQVDVWKELEQFAGKPSGYFADREEDEFENGFDNEFVNGGSGDESGFQEFVDFMNSFANKSGNSYFDFVDDSPKQHARGEKPNRGKKPKKESKGEAQQANLLGDIRTLYLLLARALHPDKETDLERRTEKTVWMQKVTVAYGAKNLGDLLDILIRNPLNSLGPYLEATPEATLRGFAKRLRRELQGLTKQTSQILLHYPQEVRTMISGGTFSEPGFKAWTSRLKNEIKIFKKRLGLYSDLPTLVEILEASRFHSWEELL